MPIKFDEDGTAVIPLKKQNLHPPSSFSYDEKMAWYGEGAKGMGSFSELVEKGVAELHKNVNSLTDRERSSIIAAVEATQDSETSNEERRRVALIFGDDDGWDFTPHPEDKTEYERLLAEQAVEAKVIDTAPIPGLGKLWVSGEPCSSPAEGIVAIRYLDSIEGPLFLDGEDIRNIYHNNAYPYDTTLVLLMET